MKRIAFPSIGTIAQHSLVKGEWEMSIREAAVRMDSEKVSSLVIEGVNQERYVFSVDDLLEFVHAGGDCEIPLSRFPVRRLSCVSEKLKLLVVLEHLEQNGLRHLGVQDAEGRLVGVVTHTDILAAIDPAVLLERKTVGELVSRSEPVLFTSDWILEDVIHHFMRAEDAVLVMEEGRPAGIITTKNVFEIISSGGDASKPLSAYMSSPVITIPANASISDTLSQLKKHRIKRAIVVDDAGRLQGVISQSELVGYAYGSWIHILKDHSAELQELVEMLSERARNLEHLSTTDVLTGLGNRRLMQQKISEEIERIRRYDVTAFSFVIADIDHFKQINDRHGHQVGDEVLKSIGKIVQESVRKMDVAIRWGGEEFAVMLANTSLGAAIEYCDRVRRAVEAAIFQQGVKLTLSFGVGEYIKSETEFELFRRVDKALYRAKQNGRNRVESDAGASRDDLATG